MVVSFCGHRDIVCSDKLKRQLRFVLCDLITEGADSFLLGGYGAFDSMAAMTIRELKSTFSHIRSTLVLACLDREYNEDLYDNTIYPPLEGSHYDMLFHNETNGWWMPQMWSCLALSTAMAALRQPFDMPSESINGLFA